MMAGSAWLASLSWLVGVWLTLLLDTVDSAMVNLTVTQGVLSGQVLEPKGNTVPQAVNVFYGVPYAKPPVGDLRFQPPQDAEGWDGVRTAIELPNSCWQTVDTAFDRFPGVEMWNPNTNMSEDCLYLNMWIPAQRTNKTILVFIYGGGFWAGTSTLRVYDAQALAAREGVIVVSFNYRIGPLGFLYTGTKDSPGNAGLLDQAMALQWVKDNAINLGGDPDQILIYGESAGAASVGFHLLSPLTSHLFTRAFMMSASPLVHWGIQSHDLATSRAKLVASQLGCETEDIGEMMSCLRRANAQKLTDLQWQTINLFFDVPFGPVVDGHFFPRHPADLTADGMVKNTSIMAGVVKDEGTFWVLYGFPDVFSKQDPNPVSADNYTIVTDKIIKIRGPAYDLPVVRELAKKEYYDSFPPWARPSYQDAIDDISGDLLFKCAVVDFADAFARATSNRVFLYSFEYRVSTLAWPQWLGTAHGYELELVFGQPWLHPDNYTQQDRTVSDAFMKRIAAFAKTGDPNKAASSDDVLWPAYTTTDMPYLVFETAGPQVKQGLRYDACNFWRTQIPIVQQKAAEFTLHTCADSGHTLTSLGVPSLLLVALLVALSLPNSALYSSS